VPATAPPKPKVDINNRHPKYHLRNEVLCMIPCHPNWASLRTIAEDLNVPVKKVRYMVDRLIDAYGYELHRKYRSKEEGSFVSCPRSQWPVVRVNATRYWKEVYGE